MGAYSKLNESFTDICIYRIGNHAGFFSEINNMIMAMIYCLENNKRFKLYSTNGLYCNDVWLDFFEHFTAHTTHPFHKEYNGREFKIVKKANFDKPETNNIRKYLEDEFPEQEVYLTQNVWPIIRNHKIYTPHYQVKSAFVNGNIIHAGYEIIKSIWRINRRTVKEVVSIKRSVNIPTPYAGIHIRRGDKSREAKFKPLDHYLKKIDHATNQENYPVFIATDDQRVITEVKKINPRRPVYHFNFPDNNGFDMDKFSVFDSQQQRNGIIQLLAEVEMLVEANLFVGTFTSNVGMFVGMARDAREIYGVDTDWQVW